jgi:hypothetical protein
LSPTLEKFIRIKAKPDALLTHLAWIEALPGMTVSVQAQPDDPGVSVLHVVTPLDQGQDDDVDQIVRHWERKNPRTLLTDWLEEDVESGS